MPGIDLRDASLPAAAVIAALELRPHPEGGHYREIWRDAPADGGRGAGTAIYFLLDAGERSHWHRVDAAEAWHWYAGGPLALSLSADGQGVEERLLGPDLGAGQQPFGMVPKGWWQAARPLGGWVLVGCTVSPAFDFAGFELAPPGWKPAR
ncbi:cupin domain-containing protein [Pseudoroseomonas wenyumeiae]|uniref:Cupin domain-containing protein n=1 Tax=Teichococcus wenyumeiae TaxID=2478470 RepID=A0A3A9JQV7_9PROT|nr:cupin domain-containing protein [Pseudoroseomonas wenyumeiae]RKK01349.1 cupin domain-containing protein [Pseudoroseomonas wenyumeiae]RMI24732.1 cupin domain-containing protein [Pseudoroseomonas wenyumeiae]